MKIFFSIIITILGIENLDAQSEIFGLATPIQLELETTVVYLEDYFADAERITSVTAPDFLRKELSADKQTLTLTVIKNDIPFLSELNFEAAGNTYSILLRKSKKERVVFSFDPKEKSYSTVSIVGEMTNWNPHVAPMKFTDGKWQTELILNPGRYQYQIVADGNWFLDPGNPVKIDNGIGGYNSLMEIGGRDERLLPHTQTHDISANGSELFIRTTNSYDDDGFHGFFFWNNERLYDDYYVLDENDYFECNAIKIPQKANEIRRSYIRFYSFNKYGEGNDILIPLEYGKVITDPSLLTKDDLQKTIMYFLMVDRFNNGDKTNDNPVNDERVSPLANYYGGDLAGIQQKTDENYFKELGVNALWISPVFQNPYNAYQEFPPPHRWFSGYHGYWPISLSQVDTRFGTNQQFKSLVDDAHQNNMSVFLDYIANHIHEQHPLWKEHPEWFSDLILPDGRKNLRLWDEQRLTTWFEPYMPSFDHSKPIVAEACADSAMWWLKEFNLDGFRHDATKHIEIEFWRLLTEKIKTEIEIPQNRNIYQIGETFGSRELIGSYLGSGLLNAQFDFSLYFDARSVFANDETSFNRLSASLNESLGAFGYHHLMGNITGNHDMARFISYASGDLKWDENDKEAGWHRKIEVTDTIGYSKLKMLHAFNMTIPGIPIIYYGDEIGLPGANDPDSRRMMLFDSLNRFQLDVKNIVSQLARLRSEHMALLYGDFTENRVNDTTYIYTRTYFDDKVMVVFNKSKSPQVIEIPATAMDDKIARAHFGSILSRVTHTINPGTDPGTFTFYSLIMSPYSFEIITFE